MQSPATETEPLINREHSKSKANVLDYSPQMKLLLFSAMLFVNILGPLSTEAQVPALQDIAIDLDTTSTLAQLTITIYMLSFGLSQLIFGSLSDIFGRRHTLLFGLIVYTLTNIGCALSPNIFILILFRVFQAVGSGTCMVIVYAIARDIFNDPEQRVKVLGLLGGIRPLIIAASPVFGGTVCAYLSWRYIFWIIGGLSLLLTFFVFLILPETMPLTNVNIVTLSDYIAVTKDLFKEKVFMGLVFISGAVYAGVFIMFNEFSFVMENTYGFSEFDTGLLCGGIVFGLLVGSVISIILKKYNPFHVILYGIMQVFVTSILLLIPCLLFDFPDYAGITVYWTIFPLFLYVCSDGIMLPYLVSTALEPFQNCAGIASSLAGFYRFFSAALIALVISSSTSYHLATLHYGTFAMGIVACIVYAATLVNSDKHKYLPDVHKHLLPQYTQQNDESKLSVEWSDEE